MGVCLPGGSFKPNQWGLHDMHGNVSEWCSDTFDAEFYQSSPRRDPIGAISGSQVTRGGSWKSSEGSCRSANREAGLRTDHAFDDIGLRLVRRADDAVAEPKSNKAIAPPSAKQVRVGVFAFEVPFVWEVVSEAHGQTIKKEILKGVKQMIETVEQSSGSDQGLLGMQDFQAVKMPFGAGWFIAYTVQIPQQKDYLSTMEKDQEQKIAWGKSQGIITDVYYSGRCKIADTDVVKIDTAMGDGTHSIGFYYWSPSEPGLVGTISVIVNPGKYPEVNSALDSTFESLRIVHESK